MELGQHLMASHAISIAFTIKNTAFIMSLSSKYQQRMHSIYRNYCDNFHSSISITCCTSRMIIMTLYHHDDKRILMLLDFMLSSRLPTNTYVMGHTY